MRRRLIWPLIISIFLSLNVLAANEYGAEFAPKPGEVLVYRLYLAGLPLGEQRLAVKAARTEDGKPALLLEETLDSLPSVLWLLDYHERRSVLWDADAAAPLYESATITQRRSVVQEQFKFDRERGLVWVTKTHGDGTSDANNLGCSPGTQTGCSLLYYLRTFPWERGQSRLALLGSRGTEWYTFTAVAEKNPFTVPYGRFEQSYHLSNRELKYDVWFDRGPGHLPLEIRSRLGPGIAQARLVAASGFK